MKPAFKLLSLIVLITLCAGLAGCGAEATVAPEPTKPQAQPTEPVVQPTEPVVQPTEPPAPTATTPPVVVQPTTLVVAMNIDGIITLDPGWAFEIEPPVIMNATYDSLVETLPGDLNTYAPRLAESWDVSPDGLVVTFHLRPGVKFASGNPVTAEDVRFSWQRLINLKGSGAYYLDMVSTIEATDELTLKVTLKYPSPVFMSAVSTQLLSALDSKVVKEHGATDAADADKTDTAKEWLDQNSAGSGPYVQTSWTPKSEIVMVANPNYFRGAPKIDKIIIKNVTDPTVAFQMLQTGEADIVYSLDVDLAKLAEADPNISVVAGQMYNMDYIALTSSPELSEPLSKTPVKQAILLAIDYDGIINGILGGYAIRAPSAIPMGVMGVDPAMIQPRDVEKAKALLKEAGYENGFEVDLSYGITPVRDSIAAKIQADLAEVGITVNLKPLELSVYFTEARAQKLAFLIGPYATDRMDPSNWVDYMSFCDSGVAKRLFYCNKESERLATASAQEMDPVKRAQYVNDLQKVWMADAWATLLYQPQQIVGVSKKVQGFEYHPFVLTYFDWLSFTE